MSNKLLKYTLNQIILGLLKLLVVLFIVFMLIKLMKVDVVPQKATLAVQNSIRHQYGLDLPVWQQFINFLSSAIRLDFGSSWKLEESVPVFQMIGEKLPYSIFLGISAYIISIIAGFFAGSALTKNVGNKIDTSGTIIMLLLHSIPLFVLGAVFQLLGSMVNFPISYDDQNLISWVLPVFLLSLVMSSSFTKQFRFYLIDVYTQEYISTARAKGLSEADVLKKHARRNALVPMLEPIISQLLGVIVGTVSIEKLFNIPGIGNLLLNAVSAADQPVILAMVTILTSLSIISMTIVNIAYTFVDPRIKLGE